MHIGVIGTGEAPSERVVQLVLQDAIDWTSQEIVVCLPRNIETTSLEWARDWAAQRLISTSVSSAEAVVDWTMKREGKVYVFWDTENTELHQLVEKALASGTEVFDICQPGTRIAPPPKPERKKMPKLTKPPVYSRTELEALTATEDGQIELAAISLKFGINAEDDKYADWPDVVKAVLAAQKKVADGDAPAEVADEDDGFEDDAPAEEAGEEFEPYTELDLQKISEEAKGLDKLKAILTEDFGGEVPGARPRATTIIKLILEAQEALMNEDGEEEEEPEVDAIGDVDVADLSEEESGEDIYDALPIDEIIAVVQSTVEASLDAKLAILSEAIEASFVELSSKLDDVLANVAIKTPAVTSASMPAASSGTVRRLPARRR